MKLNWEDGKVGVKSEEGEGFELVVTHRPNYRPKKQWEYNIFLVDQVSRLMLPLTDYRPRELLAQEAAEQACVLALKKIITGRRH